MTETIGERLADAKTGPAIVHLNVLKPTKLLEMNWDEPKINGWWLGTHLPWSLVPDTLLTHHSCPRILLTSKQCPSTKGAAWGCSSTSFQWILIIQVYISTYGGSFTTLLPMKFIKITSSTQQKHIKNHHKTRPPQYGRHDLPVPPSHIVVVGHLLLCGADDLFRTQSQGFQLSAQAWTVRSWLSEGRKNLHFCRKITIKWPQKAASGDSSSRLAQGLLIWFLASQDHTQETNVTTGLQGSFEDSFDGSVGLRYLPPLWSESKILWTTKSVASSFNLHVLNKKCCFVLFETGTSYTAGKKRLTSDISFFL